MRLKADMLDAQRIAGKVARAAAKADDTYKAAYYKGVAQALIWATDSKYGNTDFFLDIEDIKNCVK